MNPNWPVLFLLLATPVAAQQSASYRVEEHVFNSGGSPAAGPVPASASFRVSLGSLGDGLAARDLSSASFRGDAGFLNAYPPPGEVGSLRFTSKTTLSWSPERSVGTYNLYRGSLSTVAGLGYGACAEQGLTGAGATDAEPVPSGGGLFYLATAVNRLDEEGTKGFRSNGVERQGTVCP